MSAHLELILAGPEHRCVLENLLELYIHDFSEFVCVDVGQDGRFGYKGLPFYWCDVGRRAFLAKWDGQLAGFALVKKIVLNEGAEAWDMAEFFVLRRYRRRGLGAAMAHEVWRGLPGRWQVRVMEANVAAARFWEAAIAGYVGRAALDAAVFVDGVAWRVFSFESLLG